MNLLLLWNSAACERDSVGFTCMNPTEVLWSGAACF